MLRMKTPETQALVSGCSLSSRRLYQHTLTRHITSNNREPQTKEDPEKGSKVELDLNEMFSAWRTDGPQHSCCR